MKTQTLKKSLVALIFAIVIGTPLAYFPQGVFPYSIAKQAYFQSLVELLLAGWLALAYFDPQYRPRKTPLVIAGGIFLGLLTLAALLGVDPWRSFWSTYEREIGVVAFYHFAAFALVLSSMARNIPWRKLLYGSLATSLFIDVVAFLQLGNPTILLAENPGSRPGATFGNPTFLSGYLIFQIFLAAYLMLDLLSRRGSDREYVKRYRFEFAFLAVAVIADIGTVFMAQSRGDVLALGAGIVALCLVFFLSPPKFLPKPLSSKAFYAGCFMAILILAGIFLTTYRSPFWSRVPGLDRFKSLSLSYDSLIHSDVGPRIFALRAAWLGFLDRPILGWGPENYNIVFNKYYDPRSLEFSYGETQFDKPHNFLAEYLVTGGVLLFLAFIALFGAAIYEAVHSRNRLWSAIFIPIVIAYVVGASFIFETAGPLMMLYIIFGMTDGEFTAASPAVSPARTAKHIIPAAPLFIAAIAGLALVWFVNADQVFASYYQYGGFQDLRQQSVASALENFRAAQSIANPYTWNFNRDYAIAVDAQYFNNPGTVSDSDALAALHAMEQTRDEHPLDAFNHYALVNLYNEVARIDKVKYTAAAEGEAKTSLELSPGRQVVYFYLAKTKTLENDFSGALAVLKTALDEDPHVPDAHFYYGILAYAVGKPDLGYAEIKSAINLGRIWQNGNEARAAANDLADSGHLEDAIYLYQKAMMADPGDLESELKLGIAEYYAGNQSDARQYLTDVAAKVDLAKLPSYSSIVPIYEALGISIANQ